MNFKSYEKQNVAILFFGITRSLNYTIENWEENFLQPLRKFYNITKFMHIFKLSQNSINKRSNEFFENFNFDEYKLLEPDYFEWSDENMIKNLIKIHEYRTFGDPWGDSSNNFKSLDNFILQTFSKMRVTYLMYKTNIKFDYVIFIRPDVKIITPFDIKWFQFVKDNVMVIPNHAKYPINDRMAICNYNNAKIYGYVFNKLLEDSKKFVIHAEKYLEYILNNNKIFIYEIEFCFKRVRMNGYVEENDC